MARDGVLPLDTAPRCGCSTPRSPGTTRRWCRSLLDLAGLRPGRGRRAYRRSCAGWCGRPPRDGPPPSRRRPAWPGDSPSWRAAERQQALLDLVRAQVAGVLGHAGPEPVEPQRAFKDLGFDSLTAVELRNRLTAATGLRLPATLVFDHPTPAALARYLRVGWCRRRRRHAAARRRSVTGPADEPIAIVGMACRYPGGVDSPEDAVAAASRRGGRDRRLPRPTAAGTSTACTTRTRTTRHRVHPARRRSCTTRTHFDAGLLRHQPRARRWPSTRSSGCCWRRPGRPSSGPGSTRTTLRGSRTGVFTGVMYNDYASRLQRHVPEGFEGYLGTGSAGSVASGRVAYTLGLRGPGGHRRHGVLVVAGRRCTWRRRRCAAASATWRWPAA